MDTLTDSAFHIGQTVKFSYRLGNENIIGRVMGYGYNVVTKRWEVRVVVTGDDMPNGWYRASFWKPVTKDEK
jgi:phage major head subunit gpT-like protein